MALEETSTRLLSSLPAVAAGGVTVRLLDRRGRLQAQCGEPDETTFEVCEGRLEVTTPPERVSLHDMIGDGGYVLVTLPAERRADLQPFLELLLQVLSDMERIERDMESINSTSLALLEEVSLIGDTLPRLATGQSEAEIAEMGLRALVVAASVKRAMYLRYVPEMRQCEVVAHVVSLDGGWNAEPQPWNGDPTISEDEGLLWRAIHGNGAPVLETVPEGGRLGDPGRPESLARRQVIVVPVRYGSGDKPVTLGALVVMDKRANAYSNQVQLGSQETKMAAGVASMLGSVLGTRMVAELDSELRTATQIQTQILPERAPSIPGYEVEGLCKNSGAVGGDYFDFLPMASGRILAVVADVSGHNLASGMLMVSARATLRTLAAARDRGEEVFDAAARVLFEDLRRTERFITVAGVELAADSGAARIVNAGHNDTMVLRADTGCVERVPSQSPVMGFLPDPSHEAEVVCLQPGDALLLYTDGVTEVLSAQDEMFGEDRLAEVLRRVADGSAREILAEIFDAVEAWADKSLKGDDVTAVVIKRIRGEAPA